MQLAIKYYLRHHVHIIHEANVKIVVTWGHTVVLTSTAGPVFENCEEPRWCVESMDGICQVPAELRSCPDVMDGRGTKFAYWNIT